MTIAASAGSEPTRSAISGIVVYGESQASTISSMAPSWESGRERTRSSMASSRLSSGATSRLSAFAQKPSVTRSGYGGVGCRPVQIHVAFTPRDAAPGRVQVVVDCIRATTTIAQALAAGYERVVCVGEVEDAVRERGPRIVLGDEREGVLIEGFDLGNSPAEYEVPQGSTLVLTTTNGTRAILRAAEEAEIVIVGALTCL